MNARCLVFAAGPERDYTQPVKSSADAALRELSCAKWPPRSPTLKPDPGRRGGHSAAAAHDAAFVREIQCADQQADGLRGFLHKQAGHRREKSQDVRKAGSNWKRRRRLFRDARKSNYQTRQAFSRTIRLSQLAGKTPRRTQAYSRRRR